MDLRVQELIDITKTKFGLNNYYLQEHRFYRSVNSFNETIYTLSLEWFPNHAVPEEDGSNPDGTASIEINLKSRKFERVIFVMGKSYSEGGIMFSNLIKEDIIKWVEAETGFTYGEQFRLKREDEGEFNFIACIDGIAVSPPGYIDIEFNQEGKLTLFSISGQFPSKELIKVEKYALSLERLDHLEKEQLKLVEYPSYEQKKIYPIYAMEEIFVANDGATTIPFGIFANGSYFLKMDQTILWDEPMMKKPFERKMINWIEDISAEQAFSCEPSPDSFPITKVEQEKCMMAVENLLRQEYPKESGYWVLKEIYRDKGYIHATLKAIKQDYRMFQRKIKAWIDPKSFQVVNYMDSKLILKTFDDFQAPDQVKITKEEAYEKLKSLFELKPYYVYDFKQKQYILCGKLDCQFGLNASNGEVIALDDL